MVHLARTTQAVIFDVDGVLLDSTRANIAFYQELFRRAGLPVPTTAELEAQNHLSVPDMLALLHPELPADRIQAITADGDSITVGYDLLQLPPGATDVVPRLAKTYKLGIASNRSRAAVEELWMFSGLRPYFSAVAAYEDVINHKPDPEPLLYVLKKVNVEPSQAVFIGDAPTDLAAAQAAGTKFIMFGLEMVPTGIPTATNFQELPDLITQTLGGS